jgi:catechol 2,3-dioxygenase-like lactoylglutathione lyase family enzyme
MPRVAAAALVCSVALGVAQQAPRVDVTLFALPFIAVVHDADTTSAFYQALGLQSSSSPSPALASWTSDSSILRLHGAARGEVRFAPLSLPGGHQSIELIEWRDIDRAPVRPRILDPGAATLVLEVRDVDAVLRGLRPRGVRVLTVGGEPIPLGDLGSRARAAVIVDPDGHFVELLQPELPPRGSPQTADLIAARTRVTVADTERTMKLYRDRLGLQAAVGDFRDDRQTQALYGLGRGEVRTSSVEMPASTIEFIEFRGFERTPVQARSYDPGATGVQLQVRNVDAALDAFRQGGAVVVSTGGQAVDFPGPPEHPELHHRLVALRDLNNLFVFLTEEPGARRP